MRFYHLCLICSTLGLLLPQTNAATKLFNGKNFDGWEIISGIATYEIVDGAIVGTPHPTSGRNTFLVYQKEFSDFILEFEFMIDDTQNSGVQFRSHCKYDDPAERFGGFQYEMDPSPRAWSAGVYEEGAEGWLYPLLGNPKAQRAFIHQSWNKARIEAIGDHIRTWINGVPATDLITNHAKKGYIGLQVHHLNSPDQARGKVAWRNITIEEDVARYATPYTAAIAQISTLDNRLTEREKQEGWVLLWDGRSSKGWSGANSGSFPQKDWKLEDGILRSTPGKGEDIITTKSYKNFELSIDFNITYGTKSGIAYAIRPEHKQARGAALVYSILDDTLVNHQGSHATGSLGGVIPAATNKRYKADGFNNARIIVKDGHVEHWLNGIKTVDYNRMQPTEGHILLQHQGTAVQFKSIKMRELK